MNVEKKVMKTTRHPGHPAGKKTLSLLFMLLCMTVAGQDNPTAEAQPIVAEGKRLYHSEMASWYGTDLFLENYPNKAAIGGYFSYTENEVSKCIFFSKGEKPKVIGTILFDSTYSLKTARLSLAEREFTEPEYDLYAIRKIALQEVNTDTLFKFYQNTNLNLIPLIHGREKKVYVLTGPREKGVVVFGNDYLLTFDEQNNLLVKKQLHKNIMQLPYGGKEEEAQKSIGSVHMHLPETGHFITATDICTLMLYAKFTPWKQHIVFSEKYMNIWDCESHRLTVLPRDAVEKIMKDQEKKKNKEE